MGRPRTPDRLVGDLIDADDGGGCFYTDAQPIDYTQGMDYSPQQLAADSGLGDTVPLACESNASYSLAHHPDIKFTATGSPDGRKALEVSAPGSARHALITAKPGAFDVSLHDERGIVSGESFPYEANDSGRTGFPAGRCAARWTSPSAGPTHRKRLLRPQGSTSRWMTAWKRHTDDKAKEHMMDMNWTDEIRDPEPLKEAHLQRRRLRHATRGPVLP